MDIDNASNAGRLLSYIEDGERERRQIAESHDGEMPNLPTRRFLRPPLTINELLLRPCKKGVVVWLHEYETLVVINYHNMGLLVEYTDSFDMNFHLDDETQIFVDIYGDSVDRILETALFFASLPVAENTQMTCFSVSMGRFTFNDDHENQLARLLDAISNSTKNIAFLEYSRVNNVFARVLATRPYPLQLTFDQVARMDVGAFLDHLGDRDPPFFGSLYLGYCPIAELDLECIMDNLNFFQDLQVRRLSNDLLLKLLAAPMGHIAFAVGEENEELDLSDAAIVSKDIQLFLPPPNESTTRIMVSFLDRMATCGHVESLKLESDAEVPEEVVIALLRAVRSNKNLTELKVNTVAGLKTLLAGLANHKGLRILCLNRYPGDVDPDYTWIMQLLTRNRRLRAFCLSDYCGIFKDAVNEAYARNRFYFWSVRLQQEPESIRAFLVGAALTRYAACVERIHILLTHHRDLLCGQRETVPTDGAEVDIMEVAEEN